MNRILLLASALTLATVTGASAEPAKLPPQFVGNLRTCAGELYDMRETGVTLGDCDLNHVSDSDFTYVKSQCGEPWSIGDDFTPHKCSIKVISSRTKLRVKDPPAFASVAYFYRVFKVKK